MIALLRLPPAAVELSAARSQESRLARLSAGMRFVGAHPELRRLMLLAFLPLLFGMPYQALMPAVAAEVFHVDAAGLGLLLTLNGLGALAGSIVIAGVDGAPGTMARVQLIAGIVFGIGLLVFGLTPVYGAALPILAVVGGASAAYTSINNTLLMSYTPPEYHGRVMGVYMMTFASMPLSSLPAARVAEAIGLPPTLVVSGALVVLAVIIGGSNAWKRQTRAAPSPDLPTRSAASFPSSTPPSSRTGESTSVASGASSTT
jgi:predicted MFS family arabinose efflux permease